MNRLLDAATMKGCFVCFIAALAILAGDTASACSCAGRPPIATAFADADAVFVGQVSSFRVSESVFGLIGVVVRHLWSQAIGRDDAHLEAWESSSRYGRVTHLSVTEAFKGGTTPIATVSTGFGDGDCGYRFVESTEYLVYAYYTDDALNPGQRFLSTGICTRTQPTIESGDEVAELRRLRGGER